MGIFDPILSTARYVTAEQAPHIHAKLNALAKKAGIKEGIEFILCDHPSPNAFFAPTRSIKNAPYADRKYVFVTQGLLDAFGSSLHGPVNAELEAVLAHELSHAKHHGTEMAWRHLPTFLLPLAAMIGVHLYDSAKQKQREQAGLSNADALDAAHADAHAQLHPNAQSNVPNYIQESIGETILRTAKYMAAAVLGLAVGLIITKHASIAHEFRADRFSAQLTGSKEAMASALAKFEQASEKFLAAHPQQSLHPIEKFLQQCLHGHPSTVDRIAALRR